MKNRVWYPILKGRTRDRAMDIVERIATDLRSQKTDDASLASGTAGLAILFSYLKEARFAHKFRNHAIDALQTIRMSASFYSGITGIGWTIEHLEKRNGRSRTESEIDTALGKYLQLSPWSADYDLVSGLVGFGVYALERLPNSDACKCAELIIDRLAEISVEDETGIAWFTPSALLPEWQRAICPEGYYNLGLAHGIPGVVGLLSLLYSNRIKPRKTRRLLEGAVRWMLNHRLSALAGSSFPAWIAKNVPSEESRSAWCYGDPGVAIALFSAARSLRNKTYEEEALSIAKRAAGRKPENCAVIDAPLCHGAAGLGHIYNRFYQATGESIFLDSARYWFEQTLTMHRAGEGVGGYLAYMGDENGWQPESGILTGAAGIALALYAACTNVEPQWDRFLLLSIPPSKTSEKPEKQKPLSV